MTDSIYQPGLSRPKPLSGGLSEKGSLSDSSCHSPHRYYDGSNGVFRSFFFSLADVLSALKVSVFPVILIVYQLVHLVAGPSLRLHSFLGGSPSETFFHQKLHGGLAHLSAFRLFVGRLVALSSISTSELRFSHVSYHRQDCRIPYSTYRPVHQKRSHYCGNLRDIDPMRPCWVYKRPCRPSFYPHSPHFHLQEYGLTFDPVTPFRRLASSFLPIVYHILWVIRGLFGCPLHRIFYRIVLY